MNKEDKEKWIKRWEEDKKKLKGLQKEFIEMNENLEAINHEINNLEKRKKLSKAQIGRLQYLRQLREKKLKEVEDEK